MFFSFTPTLFLFIKYIKTHFVHPISECYLFDWKVHVICFTQFLFNQFPWSNLVCVRAGSKNACIFHAAHNERQEKRSEKRSFFKGTSILTFSSNLRLDRSISNYTHENIDNMEKKRRTKSTNVNYWRSG